MTAAAQLALQSRYEGYAYSYPHKTAYRPLAVPVSLDGLWASERRDALFLYLHVPFCEMRCGFCNLFTATGAEPGVHRRYLAAMKRQAAQLQRALGAGARFARLAIGGGTPTLLDDGDLEGLFDLSRRLGADPARIPASVETSPITATDGKVTLLKQAGVSRVSIGVQSFVDSEARAAGRSQQSSVVLAALDRLAAAAFPALNIDLMYGLPGQTVQTWLKSLGEALRFHPAELFLYPLYVRELTGLGRVGGAASSLRHECYQAGRAFLLSEGFEQTSMRMFRRSGRAAAPEEPSYCCQTDGMVGLGCGARSYTASLHYGSPFAVSAGPVRGIIDAYLAAPDAYFAEAAYGFALNGEEQRRRFVIQSLLQAGGLDLASYFRRFLTRALFDLPEIGDLCDAGLASPAAAGSIRLTEAGMAASDAIGPLFYSPNVRRLMGSCELQ